MAHVPGNSFVWEKGFASNGMWKCSKQALINIQTMSVYACMLEGQSIVASSLPCIAS